MPEQKRHIAEACRELELVTSGCCAATRSCASSRDGTRAGCQGGQGARLGRARTFDQLIVVVSSDEQASGDNLLSIPQRLRHFELFTTLVIQVQILFLLNRFHRVAQVLHVQCQLVGSVRELL